MHFICSGELDYLIFTPPTIELITQIELNAIHEAFEYNQNKFYEMKTKESMNCAVSKNIVHNYKI